MNEDIRTGRCDCGGVTFETRGPLRDMVACHCEQCRRTSGHFVAASAVRRDNFILRSDDTLTWYEAVSGFRRGFCSRCGSSLFFEEVGELRISIAGGALDDTSGLKIAAHIYADEAGDYYELGEHAHIDTKGNHEVPLP